MVLQVRLPYLDSLSHMSYSTVEDIPVFLNDDLLNPIGHCRLLDNDALAGILWLDREVSTDVFVYYLKNAGITDRFHFAALHLREKPLRKARWRASRVIQMPRFETGKEKRTKRLKELVAWEFEGE